LKISSNNFLNNQIVRQDVSQVVNLGVNDRASVTSVLFSLVFFSAFLFSSLFPGNAHSAAGDLISNTATINYDIGGLPNTSSATTAFTEDRRINFIVADSNGGSAVPVISDMIDAVMQFTVTNTGNDINDFLLTAVNTSPNPYGLPADSFDPLPASIQVFVESGVTPGYQAAEDTAVFVDELSPNIPRVVYVVADMPTVATDAVAAIALIAQVAEGGAASAEGAAINADDNSHTSPAGVFSNGTTNMPAGVAVTNPDTLGMETVFNDPAGANPEDLSTVLVQDIASNGQHSDASAYQVTPPVILTKTVTVIDTLGGIDPHPGATLRYQLDVSVAGNTSVSNLVITDPIPTNTTYTDGTILLNGVAQTDANDAPIDFSRAVDILSKPVVNIEVDLSQGGTVDVAPGDLNVIIFEVTID
jgi:uncharacterized repeat protein (TIGR01451 family)